MGEIKYDLTLKKKIKFSVSFMLLFTKNIRFNDEFEVVNVGFCGPRLTLMPDAERRAFISTEGRNKR